MIITMWYYMNQLLYLHLRYVLRQNLSNICYWYKMCNTLEFLFSIWNGKAHYVHTAAMARNWQASMAWVDVINVWIKLIRIDLNLGSRRARKPMIWILWRLMNNRLMRQCRFVMTFCRESDCIIWLATPVIGPKKSKKLTRLIALAHNIIRSKV